MKIFRNQNGEVINIGEWDYRSVTENIEKDDGTVESVTTVYNPLPIGAYEDEGEIGTLSDGSLYVIGG